MIGSALVFILVMKIMSKRGRNSPAWGIGAVILAIFLEAIMPLALISIFNNEFHFYDDHFLSMTEKKLLIYSGLLSYVLAILVFFLISKRFKKSNWRNEIKDSKLNYQHIAFLITLLAVYFAYEHLITFGMTRVTFFFIITLIVFTTIVVTYCFRYHKQLEQAKAYSKINSTMQADILLLRSFQQSGKVSRDFPKSVLNKVYINYFDHIIFGYTFEQVLTPYLNNKVGEIVTMGDPNDYLPELGAPKIYMPDEKEYNKQSWWDVVTHFIDKVQVIIVFESSGNSVQRELAYIRKYIDPKKLFLISYPTQFGVKNWHSFYQICKASNIHIPEKSLGGVVFTFNNDWACEVSSTFENNINDLAEYIKYKIYD